MAKHGLALDNVIGADVVTAQGRLLIANAEEIRTSSGACAAAAVISGS